MNDSVPLKRCTKCGIEKEATKEFYSVDKRYTCGFYPSCKKCRSKVSKDYNKRHHEKCAVYDKKYRESHRELKREIDNRSRDKRRESRTQIMREYGKEWREKNPLKVKAKSAKSRAIRSKAAGSYTNEDIALQLKTQKGLCWWCGCELEKYHIDHRIPLTRGGTHNPDNIVISCPHCNLTKNNKMPWEWIGRLV